MFPSDTWLYYLLACLLVLLLLRILRVADTARPAPRAPAATATRSPISWFRARKLDKLASTTALSRAHTEFFHSKIDELQAFHDLQRLVAELEPTGETTPPRQAGAPPTNRAALTLTEIQDLLAVLNLEEQTRADVLRLAAARLAEKRS